MDCHCLLHGRMVEDEARKRSMVEIESNIRRYDLVKILDELEQCKLDQTIEGLRSKSDHQ